MRNQTQFELRKEWRAEALLSPGRRTLGGNEALRGQVAQAAQHAAAGAQLLPQHQGLRSPHLPPQRRRLRLHRLPPRPAPSVTHFPPLAHSLYLFR